jgi:hypothetical protein
MKDALIAEYRSAYAAANGKELDSALLYERGWFLFMSPHGGWVEARYRRKRLEGMRDRLRAIAGEIAPSPALSHEEAGR